LLNQNWFFALLFRSLYRCVFLSRITNFLRGVFRRSASKTPTRNTKFIHKIFFFLFLFCLQTCFLLLTHSTRFFTHSFGSVMFVLYIFLLITQYWCLIIWNYLFAQKKSEFSLNYCFSYHFFFLQKKKEFCGRGKNKIDEVI
jgi:hypothetical protein